MKQRILYAAEKVLTGKIFEYLSARKPIIVLGPDNIVDAYNLIEKNNLGLFVNTDDDNVIFDKLNYLYSLNISGKIKNHFNKDYDISKF